MLNPEANVKDKEHGLQEKQPEPDRSQIKRGNRWILAQDSSHFRNVPERALLTIIRSGMSALSVTVRRLVSVR